MVKEEKKMVLFLCIENSSRSQMAEGFAKKLGIQAASAGTTPSTQVNSYVVQAMLEKGIDISQNKPKGLTPEMVDQAGLVVLTDPSIMKSLPRTLRWRMRNKHVDWSIANPQGQPIEAIRLIRDQIESKVTTLANEFPPV
jgi:protein-tyrosine-phosphatase